jgi:hypothetical protein
MQSEFLRGTYSDNFFILQKRIHKFVLKNPTSILQILIFLILRIPEEANTEIA